ncbi:MAG: sterol desaturase family protein [Cytophagaceae bacterium]|nr:sterol desaturase family protein [Cytophagaceae bacterium]
MEENIFKSLLQAGSWVFVTHFLRYLLFAGIAYVIFYHWKKRYWQHKKIQAQFPKRIKIQLEFLYSISTFLIFSAFGVAIYLLKNQGYTLIYQDIHEYGTLWFFVSIFLSLVLHDTYFYWTHRLMHTKFLFPYFHKIHHISYNPSPWASFSFHPLEAIVEAGILPLLVFILPLHPGAIIIFLFIMTVMNVLGHLGYELYPSGFLKTWLGKWNNTSTHHNMHHQYGHSNYGLYFNWWDRIMKTNHEAYEKHFEKTASRKKEKIGYLIHSPGMNGMKK